MVKVRFISVTQSFSKDETFLNGQVHLFQVYLNGTMSKVHEKILCTVCTYLLPSCCQLRKAVCQRFNTYIYIRTVTDHGL